MLRQPSSHRSRLLRTEVKWEVFLVLVEDPELRSLRGVDDCEDAGNGFAEIVTI